MFYTVNGHYEPCSSSANYVWTKQHTLESPPNKRYTGKFNKEMEPSLLSNSCKQIRSLECSCEIIKSCPKVALRERERPFMWWLWAISTILTGNATVFKETKALALLMLAWGRVTSLQQSNIKPHFYSTPWGRITSLQHLNIKPHL